MNLNLTIGKKIMLGYALALLVISAIGIASYESTAKLIATTNERKQTHNILRELDQVLSLAKDAQIGTRGFVITGDNDYLKPYHDAKSKIEGQLAKVNALIVIPEQRRLLEELETEVRQGFALREHIIDLRKTQGAEAAIRNVQSGQGKNNMDDIRDKIALLSDAQEKLLEQHSKDSETSAKNAIAFIVGGGGFAFVLLLLVGFMISRSITRPIGRFMEFVEQVGKGDLTRTAEVSSSDEIGRLGASLNQMVAGLREVAGQTRSATETLNAATAEILASTKQQVASTEEQAVAVQQTTATVEEIGQTGTQISDRAKKVSTSAENTSQNSAAGLQAVQNTSRTMDLIQEQAESVAENIIALSQKTQAVGEIISSVNDIAEQSNLLALNAAIEAAAAGDQGRRFSVVANEMKNLADQAKQATTQVRSILSEIQKGINTSVMLTEEAVKRVDSGKQQSQVAEKTIRQMTDGIQESVQAFQQIVAATGQQQIGFEQVTLAMKSIRLATEQTASGINQQEKAAAGINAMAQQLRQTVERYKL